MVKCNICTKVKGKRNCCVLNSMICSKCCGQVRSWNYCNTSCEYFPEEILNYQPFNSQKAEVTMLPHGITTKFEVPLFLPNLFDVFNCIVNELTIDLLDFNRANISFSFKLESERVILENVYEKDNWKVLTSNVPERNKKLLAPLLIIPTGVGGTSNIIEGTTKYGDANITLIKTSYSLSIWLPFSTSTLKLIDTTNHPEFQNGNNKSVVHSGRMAASKHDVYWTELNTKFEYKVEIQVDYRNIIVDSQNTSMIYLGYFLPFKNVSIKNFKINSNSSFNILAKSFLALQTFKEYEDVRLWEIPLEYNFENNFHGGHIKQDLNKMPSKYHYDEYLFSDFFIFLENKEDVLVNIILNTENIVSAYFNSLKEVYEGKYSPIILTITNTSKEIKKTKIGYEIVGLSNKVFETIYLKPLKSISIPILPILIENKLSEIKEHAQVQMNVEVLLGSKIIFEESKILNFLPRETFVYDSEDVGKINKYYFYSFIARWCTPNSEIIENILNVTAKKIGVLNGYTDNLETNLLEIEGIYNTLSTNIIYISKTFSLYKGDTALHQKIHLPSNTINNGGGNCIDLTILIASCLEKLNFDVIINIVPGHAYLGVKFNDFFLYIESTFLGNKSFAEAIEEGNNVHSKYFDSNNQSRMEKCISISINEARKIKIYPMS